MDRETYRHYRNPGRYIIIDNGYIQKNNFWVEAIIYVNVDEPDKKYIRENKEFREKFIRESKLKELHGNNI